MDEDLKRRLRRHLQTAIRTYQVQLEMLQARSPAASDDAAEALRKALADAHLIHLRLERHEGE